MRSVRASSTTAIAPMTMIVLRWVCTVNSCIPRIAATATIHTSEAGISTFQPSRMNWS